MHLAIHNQPYVHGDIVVSFMLYMVLNKCDWITVEQPRCSRNAEAESKGTPPKQISAAIGKTFLGSQNVCLPVCLLNAFYCLQPLLLVTFTELENCIPFMELAS